MKKYRFFRNPTKKLLRPRTATPDTTPENSDSEDTTNIKAGGDLETSMEVQVDDDEWSDDKVEYTYVIMIECDVEILDN